MNTSEINNHLRKIKPFLGTYPADSIPSLKGVRKKGVIVNTDEKNEKGEHWTAIFVDENGTAEYFDSFGFPPLVASVQQFLDKTFPSNWKYNGTTLQHPMATSCGLFCIAFIKARASGKSFSSFISIFTLDLTRNEQIIHSLTKNGKSFVPEITSEKFVW